MCKHAHAHGHGQGRAHTLRWGMHGFAESTGTKAHAEMQQKLIEYFNQRQPLQKPTTA